MYDLLNTQARLSRQKEHLQLPTRHALHPGTWLFRVLCVKRYWVFLALTETLGSWGGSELAEGVQSIAEVLSTWEMWTKLCVMPFFSWEPQEKWFQLFPCYLGAAFTILLCPRCSLAVWCGGKPEPDKKSPMSSSVLRAATAGSSAGAMQWSAPFCQWAPSARSLVSCFCVSVLRMNMPWTRQGEW